ncbi:putative flavin dependent monooxygenase [Phlyctema vagabunda]|uniref:Flavin dependent monooxygenase n=1 Tax=Phlyctema vagabunda TaxID=108571 RepID=A0ABR4PCV2_9HELO
MGSISKRVAVIGAGVSGLTTARHLIDSGIEVVVFERSATAGGIWSYDERQPLEPRYPSVVPSIADFVKEEEEKLVGLSEEELKLRHAPPGPAYDGLKNNISTVLQELKGYPWKKGTEDFVNVRVIGDYLQSFSQNFGVEPLIKYHTRVEKVTKQGARWLVQSTTLAPDGRGKVEDSDLYDGVVVASGHYHACRVPDIPGLKEWKSTWPDRVQHSKKYRRPDEFQGKNVLLIGAGVSSTDIGREISGLANRVYQSSRGGLFDLPEAFLPPNVRRVGAVSHFSAPSTIEGDNSPPSIFLKDGEELVGIDKVIIATGYHITYPFLRDLHDDLATSDTTDETVLVTDGTQVHNLHKDIFYIPDPTLAFVGVPYYVATFTLFEFQAIAIAAVISGRAQLPPTEELRTEYRKKLQEKGSGRPFHSLKDEEVEYVDSLVEWLNRDAAKSGGSRVEGHSAAWHAENEFKMEKIKQIAESFNQ